MPALYVPEGLPEDLWSPEIDTQYEGERVRITQEPDGMRRARGLPDIPRRY